LLIRQHPNGRKRIRLRETITHTSWKRRKAGSWPLKAFSRLVKISVDDDAGEFGPDQRGQYDARAHVIYKGYMDYFVFTARGKATFERSLPTFEHVVRSYAPQLTVIHEPPKKN
jgi:hypothetical protein